MPANPVPHTPAVSVILPCYNVADYIGAAIDGIFAQQMDDFEVILVNDGSTDRTLVTAEDAIRGDRRFKIVTQNNLGLSVARNTGLDHAQGTYVAFLDGDDQFAPGFLHRLTQEMTVSGADWCACAIQLDFPDQDSLAHSAIHGSPDLSGDARWIDLQDARQIARLFPSAWNKLYRRDFVGKTRFRPGALYEDHPFYWELACRSERVRYLPQPLYRYRQGRSGQITAQASPQIFQQFDRLDEVRAQLDQARKTHTQAALSRLATRLVHERLQPVADAALRTSFVQRAKAYFAAHGLTWDWDGADDIELEHAPQIDPGLQITVLVQDGPDKANTLQSLRAQRLPITQIRQVSAGPAMSTLHDAWGEINTPWVAILRAGDTPTAGWSESMLAAIRSDDMARAAICGSVEMPFGRYNPGLVCSDPQTVCADPAALLAHPSFDIPNVTELPEWTWAMHLESDALAKTTVFVDAPLVTLAARAVEGPLAILSSLNRVEGMSPKQKAAIFAHKAQAAALLRRTSLGRFASAMHWGIIRRASGLPKGPFGPHIGPKLRKLL